MTKEVKKDTIHADGIDISVYTTDYVNEFISLTDIAKKREGEYPGYVIQNWMRSRSTISFIGLWRFYIIQVLIASNSRQLKMRRATIVLL